MGPPSKNVASDAIGVEKELCAPPGPLSSLDRITAMKGTSIVTSRKGLSEAGHSDRYLSALSETDRQRLSEVTAWEWVSVETAMAHYQACEALALPPSEIVRLGALMAKRLHSHTMTTLFKLASAAGMTPLTLLSHAHRAFRVSYRGGGVRAVKVGPAEAHVTFFGSPFASMAYVRHGWRGLLTGNLELVCRRANATELSNTDTETVFRVTWV